MRSNKTQYRRKLGMGHGSLILDGKRTMLNAGDVFLAYSHEIPVSFRDGYEAMDGGPVVNPTPKVEPEALLQKVAKGGGWYDVVNPVTGEPINDKSLREDQADDLVENGLDSTIDEAADV